MAVSMRWVLPAAFVVLMTACGHGTAHVSQPASAAPAVSTTTTTAPPPTNYQVKRGDTLGAIARQFGLPIDTIVGLNHLSSQDSLKEGQVLVIPPPPPVQLAVSPGDGQPGATIQLKLSGAKATETVTFKVDGPSGKTFTGPPHTPAADGTVTANYQTTPQDPSGTYQVGAKGSAGTTAQATFQLTPPPPPTMPN